MKKEEIRKFIDCMEKIGDIWTEEQVEYVYGTYELEEAFRERQFQIGQLFNSIEKTIHS